MHCPFCDHDELKVIDSRDAVDQNAIRRRRECLHCEKRFTTFETLDLTIQVQKRDGTYEDFQKEKLVKGIDSACRHTRVSHNQVLALASKVTADLLQRQSREVTTTELGELIMHHLQELDAIAYIRFACVYRRFKNVDQLICALQDVTPKDAEKEEIHAQP